MGSGAMLAVIRRSRTGGGHPCLASWHKLQSTAVPCTLTLTYWLNWNTCNAGLVAPGNSFCTGEAGLRSAAEAASQMEANLSSKGQEAAPAESQRYAEVGPQSLPATAAAALTNHSYSFDTKLTVWVY
jgi:hypothetical protein